MEFHPTPESWRVALVTALGALAIGAVGAFVIATRSGSVALLVTGILVVVAALATFAPALGTLTAAVDADTKGITVRRFGHATRFEWAQVTGLGVVERGGAVPDGTEYHWVFPNRSGHVVALPCLELGNGVRRELPALAAPADDVGRSVVAEHVARLEALRAEGLRLVAAPGAHARVRRTA